MGRCGKTVRGREPHKTAPGKSAIGRWKQSRKMWRRVIVLLVMVIGVKTLTREVVFFGHLTKQQGIPDNLLQPIHFLLQECSVEKQEPAHKQTHKSLLKACIKMGLREMQGYYRKMVTDDGKDMAEITQKRKDCHGLFRGLTTIGERDNSDRDDNSDNGNE